MLFINEDFPKEIIEIRKKITRILYKGQNGSHTKWKYDTLYVNAENKVDNIEIDNNTTKRKRPAEKNSKNRDSNINKYQKPSTSGIKQGCTVSKTLSTSQTISKDRAGPTLTIS